VKLPFWVSELHLVALALAGVALVAAGDRYVASVRSELPGDAFGGLSRVRYPLTVCRAALATGAVLTGLGVLATGVTVFLSEETGLRVGLGLLLTLVGWSDLHDIEFDRLSTPAWARRAETYALAVTVPAGLATAGLLAYVSLTWSIDIARTYQVLALLLTVATLRLVAR
jgi:hypothetical protein